jgi:hypothetical protein
MIDIVERLEAAVPLIDGGLMTAHLCRDAANEIRRLREDHSDCVQSNRYHCSEITRLRAALKRHGHHDLMCPVSAGANDDHCTCGFAAEGKP